MCEDANNNNVIDTSESNIALGWDEEECIAWYAPFNYESQRPVAWTQGELDGNCQSTGAQVWTSGTNGGNPDVLLLNGDTGEVEDMVNLQGMQNDYFGIYGAAVDGEGNFWGSQLGWGGRLVKVDIDDMTYEVWNTPQGPHWYGMTVDDENYVWLCSDTVGRFDPQDEMWDTAAVGGYTGCMADTGDEGLLWMSTGDGLIGVNRDTLQVEEQFATPGSYGVSIDFYGYVWTVAYYGGAHRVDTSNGDVESYNGLVGAYTYSDMTGFALKNAGGAQ